MLQTLLAARGGVEEGETAIAPRSNTGSSVDVAKPPTFNRDVSKISGFLTAYRLYIRIKMRNTSIKEQI